MGDSWQGDMKVQATPQARGRWMFEAILELMAWEESLGGVAVGKGKLRGNGRETQ